MSDMKRLTEMAEILDERQARVDWLTAELGVAKAALREVQEEHLPELMIEVGVSELKLADGRPLKLVEDCKAAITEKTHDEAVKWLIENNFGGLIKTEVVTRFPRGSHDRAVDACDKLAAEFDEVELKEVVHPSTLKAFVKERLTKGDAVPMDLFNVHPYQKAVLKKA